MLSQTATYALQAALYLAHQGDREPRAAATIAQALGSSPDHMSRTLTLLAQAGIVSHVRGDGDGFCLLVDPHSLTMASALNTFDEPLLEQTRYDAEPQQRLTVLR